MDAPYSALSHNNIGGKCKKKVCLQPVRLYNIIAFFKLNEFLPMGRPTHSPSSKGSDEWIYLWVSCVINRSDTSTYYNTDCNMLLMLA